MADGCIRANLLGHELVGHPHRQVHASRQRDEDGRRRQQLRERLVVAHAEARPRRVRARGRTGGAVRAQCDAYLDGRHAVRGVRARRPRGLALLGIEPLVRPKRSFERSHVDHTCAPR
ncbi:hypothetical protein ACFPRL_22065 [Pseudoclavibacter helvolus]